MFKAQCKSVGILISPLSPTFFLLYRFDKAPACQAPGWHKATFHPTETRVMAFSPILKCPPMPKPKPFNQRFPVFHSLLSQYSTGRSIKGARKSPVHKSPHSLCGERNLTAGKFNILSKPPNPEQ